MGGDVAVVPARVDRVYVTQPEALGLGHAILCAERVIGDEPFAILLADDMVKNEGRGALSQMISVHEQTGASVIGVEEVPPEKTRSYGIVGVEEDAEGYKAIRTMVEKPQPNSVPRRGSHSAPRSFQWTWWIFSRNTRAISTGSVPPSQQS